MSIDLTCLLEDKVAVRYGFLLKPSSGHTRRIKYMGNIYLMKMPFHILKKLGFPMPLYILNCR